MKQIDLKEFWRNDEIAHKDNCFSKESTQIALGIRMSDVEMAKKDDLRGLNIFTAGSINNGSSLTSMRSVMQATQEYGRF